MKGSCRGAAGANGMHLPCTPWRSTSGKAGSSTPSRCRRGSCSRRWRASACRRFGARDAASAPGSSARRWSRAPGIEHRNEKTLGYLRVASDEHPLAIQIFGSNPDTMAEAARMVEAAGADLVDINFGCPVRKVTKTGAGATLLDDPELACRIVSSVAEAVDVPVSVKMRRGLRDGSRDCLDVGPRLVDGRRLGSHPASALGAADVHRHRRSQPHGGARRPRRRARDRVGRHHLARPRPGRPRDDGSGRGDGGTRRPGQPVGPARDRRRRRRRAEPRGGRRRARALHPRDRARARRAAGLGLPEEVLRLVPRPRTVPEARSSRSSSCSTRPRRSSGG